MTKRLMVGLLAGGLLAATVPGVASASGPPGDCPPGDWHAFSELGLFTSLQRFDRNGDGVICLKGVGYPVDEPMAWDKRAPGNTDEIWTSQGLGPWYGTTAIDNLAANDD